MLLEQCHNGNYGGPVISDFSKMQCKTEYCGEDDNIFGSDILNASEYTGTIEEMADYDDSFTIPDDEMSDEDIKAKENDGTDKTESFLLNLLKKFLKITNSN